MDPSEARRLSVIRRYAAVADDLPLWAQEILSSRMGAIEVSAKDSFEIYLSGMEGALPRYDLVSFQKRFVEIFTQKAWVALRRIEEHRSKNLDYYVSNDYFWQEFRDLFSRGYAGAGPFTRMGRALERAAWVVWNRKILAIFGFGRALDRVGLVGVTLNRRFPPRHNSSNVSAIRWK